MTSSPHASSGDSSLRFSILYVFIAAALLRLTNFNFYLSQLLGFETSINATGGDAFNFINYFCVITAIALMLGYWRTQRLFWSTTWPLFLLMSIYLVSAILSPLANTSWIVYQMLFLIVALCIHLHVTSVDYGHSTKLMGGLTLVFSLGVLFALFAFIQIILQVDARTYVQEFNESFVQSLDDFGIMKQRYGYFLGFLLAYALFVLKNIRWKIFSILVIVLTGFGIRSFLLGAVGAAFIFLLRQPKRLLLMITTLTIPMIWLAKQFFSQGIYDTRFYPYVNALDIVQKFPFGLGLGGYPVYTEENSRQLFASFYDVNSVLDFIPTAPESDLVHLFGSLGIGLGLIHVLLIGKMIWGVVKYRFHLNDFEKCICFYFVFMSFFGLSEDSIFSINYWIFFGLCSGVITKNALAKTHPIL